MWIENRRNMLDTVQNTTSSVEMRIFAPGNGSYWGFILYQDGEGHSTIYANIVTNLHRDYVQGTRKSFWSFHDDDCIFKHNEIHAHKKAGKLWMSIIKEPRAYMTKLLLESG